MDARIVGKIVGHRLIAMPQICRRDKGASITSMGVRWPRLEGRAAASTGSAS